MISVRCAMPCAIKNAIGRASFRATIFLAPLWRRQRRRIAHRPNVTASDCPAGERWALHQAPCRRRNTASRHIAYFETRARKAARRRACDDFTAHFFYTHHQCRLRARYRFVAAFSCPHKSAKGCRPPSAFLRSALATNIERRAFRRRGGFGMFSLAAFLARFTSRRVRYFSTVKRRCTF